MAAASPAHISRLLTAGGFVKSESHSSRMVRGWSSWNAGFRVALAHDSRLPFDAPKVCTVEQYTSSSIANPEQMAKRVAGAARKLDEMQSYLEGKGFIVSRQDVGYGSQRLIVEKAEVAQAPAPEAAAPATFPGITRKCRATGARVTVTTAEAAGLSAEGGKWLTICEDHGNVCNHPTKALRDDHARDSSGWCEDCQAAMSTEARGAWADDYIPEG